jgi:ubiquitin carboxyl-terminal hydrolase L3
LTTIDNLSKMSKEENKTYRKHYIPLESNPEVFTKLVNLLGVRLAFHDVYSLEPEMLAFIPRPALALVLVFPTSDTYEQAKATDEANRQAYTGYGDDEIIWYQQTINNACGLYGILHAVSNGPARPFIGTPYCTQIPGISNSTRE